MKILVPIQAGGTSDLAARILAEPIARAVGQPVIVENRAGATGQIAAEALMRAKHDGSTLLLAPITLPVILPLIQPRLPFDPARDFAPISQIGTFSYAIAVRPDHPARDVRELMAWVRAHPRQANFGTTAAGSVPHFVGEALSRASGVPLQHVPYRSAGQVEEQVLAGDLAIGIAATSDFLEMHRAGKLRIVATSGATRTSHMPAVPTLLDQGYAIEATGWTGLFAPAGTPRAVIDSLSAAIVAAVSTRATRASLLAIGIEPTGTTPEAFAAIIKSDTARWAPVVKESGFTAD